MRNCKIFLLRWLIGWAQLLDALIGIVTLGMVHTGLSLRVAKVYCAYRWGAPHEQEATDATDA